MLKKEYISPEVQVFQCKVNTMLMVSGESLDELLSNDDFNIVPDDDWAPDDSDNVFNSHADDFTW